MLAQYVSVRGNLHIRTLEGGRGGRRRGGRKKRREKERGEKKKEEKKRKTREKKNAMLGRSHNFERPGADLKFHGLRSGGVRSA
jgi:hypothetical protein